MINLSSAINKTIAANMLSCLGILIDRKLSIHYFS